MRLQILMTVVVTSVTCIEQVANPVYQFHQRSGGNFVHGYGFPYNLQSESSIQGTITYPNVYGYPTILTHPIFATNVQNPVAPIGAFKNVPVAPTFSSNVPVDPQQQEESKQNPGRSALSPMLKLAVDAGFVRPSGSSQSDSPLYEVSPILGQDAGSVSELAYRLGAIPVAAVHDVQMRPEMIESNDNFSPVLIHQELPTVNKYTLEVPIQ